MSTDEDYDIESPEEELATIKYLQTHKLRELTDRFALSSKPHAVHKNLISLHYSQIKSPMSSRIVQECRGLVLEKSDKGYKVIAYPYKKFFNYGESKAAQLNWHRPVTVYEKLDGSLATMYWYGDSWHIASSSVPDASGPLPCKMTFAQLFWKIWNEKQYKFPTDKSLCYMFEMVTAENIIIVRPDRDAIVLHGARRLQRPYAELEPEPIAAEHGWECIQKHSFKNLAELVEASKKLNPVESEGYIVRDCNWNRLKIKSPQYVALSHLSTTDKKGINGKYMLSIIRTNEGDEFLSYFPAYSTLYKLLKSKYEHLVERLQRILDFQDPREEFLIKQSTTVAERNIIRGMISNKNTSVRAFFANYDLRLLLNLVENEVVTSQEIEEVEIKPKQQAKPDVIIKKKIVEVDSEKPKKFDDYDEDNVVGMAKKKNKKKNKTMVTEEYLDTADDDVVVVEEEVPKAKTKPKPKAKDKKETREEEDLDALLNHFKQLDMLKEEDKADLEAQKKKKKKKKH